MTAAEAQQTLDATGALSCPDGFQPEVPLWLDAGMSLSGRSAVAYDCGTFAFTGWRRGLLAADHFPADALYRTCGDSHLFARGTEWDLGPQPGGWPAVTALTVSFAATLLAGGDWRGRVLGGVNDGSLGAADAHPAPWVLYTSDREVILRAAAADGTPLRAAAPADLSAATLDFSLALACPAGLAANAVWPFGVFQTPPFCNNAGYWGTQPPPDAALLRFEVSDQGGLLCRADPGRAATYPGGPRLPLVAGWTRAGGRWLRAVHRSQGVDDSVSDVAVRGLAVSGRAGNPVFDYGAVMGSRGLSLDGVRFEGGTRGVQACGLAVAYPVSVAHSALASHTDANAYLAASNLVVDRVTMAYAGRVPCEVLAVGVVRDCHLAPGGAFPDSVFVQRGGWVAYERVIFDAEFPPGPGAFVRFRRPSAPGRPAQASFDTVYAGEGVPVARVDADAGPVSLYARPGQAVGRVVREPGADARTAGLGDDPTPSQVLAATDRSKDLPDVRLPAGGTARVGIDLSALAALSGYGVRVGSVAAATFRPAGGPSVVPPAGVSDKAVSLLIDAGAVGGRFALSVRVLLTDGTPLTRRVAVLVETPAEVAA